MIFQILFDQGEGSLAARVVIQPATFRIAIAFSFCSDRVRSTG
jgi:hypothetical protein